MIGETLNYIDADGAHIATIVSVLDDGRVVLALPHSQFYPIVRVR